MFFTRLYLGIQMKAMEIRDIIPKITIEERKMVSEKIIDNYHETSIPQRFEAITALLNKYGRRKRSTIALIRWTERRIELIIKLLNGNPPTRSYAEESLRVLIEEYYIRKN